MRKWIFLLTVLLASVSLFAQSGNTPTFFSEKARRHSIATRHNVNSNAALVTRAFAKAAFECC